jgi:hypothetical protein
LRTNHMRKANIIGRFNSGTYCCAFPHTGSNYNYRRNHSHSTNATF